MLNKLHILLFVISFAPKIQAQNWLQMNLDGDVHCLYVDTIDNLLYAGGFIGAVGTQTTGNGFGIWDGTNWNVLPDLLNLSYYFFMCGYIGIPIAYK